MIESRYKIEYVLPDEDVKKTSPFRVLWYLLLIPLVLLIVTGITYDFSFKHISRDTLALVEKAKVHIFNLGEIQETKKKDENKIQKVSKEVAKTTVKAATEIPLDVVETPVIPSATIIPSVPEITESKTNQDKIKISELTSKQELQLKTIQSQVAKNSELAKNLNQLSEKLVLEQLKTQELNSKLAEHAKDRKELEEQLNKILEKPIDDDFPLDVTIVQDLPKDIVIIESIKTDNEDITQAEFKTIKVIEDTIAKEPIQEVVQEVSQEPLVEEVVEQSATDKIIEAMADIASEKDESTETDPNETIESKSITKLDSEKESDEVSLEKENISLNETNKQKEILSDEETYVSDAPNQNTVQSPKSPLAIKETQIAEKAIIEVEVEEDVVAEKDLDKDVNTESKTDITKAETSEKQDEPEKAVESDTQATGDNSAVDDIIAAMQESQSNSTINTTLNTDKK